MASSFNQVQKKNLRKNCISTNMAKVVTCLQKFTPEEWKLASKVKHKNTERDRAAAEQLILECDRIHQEGQGIVERTGL